MVDTNSELSPEDEEVYSVNTIKLTKDLKEAAKLLTKDQVRYLVDRYYQLQRDRIRAGAQTKEDRTPSAVLRFTSDHARKLEGFIKSAMNVYSQSSEIGRWLMSNYGIGPVLSAGLIAHIDIHKANTAGKIWRFAGLDPSVTWNKKERRPWNAQLKVLCWKIGGSFVKFHKKDECFYGHLYRTHKDREVEKNERGEFADTAKRILEQKKFRDDTDAKKAYQEGRLPKGHLDARARRFAVKIFLSHLQQVWWEIEFHEKPPKPFAIAILGHANEIIPPNWPMQPRVTSVPACKSEPRSRRGPSIKSEPFAKSGP